MVDGSAVLLADEDQLQLGAIGQAIAAFKKIPLQDAMHEAKICWGLVADGIADGDAVGLISHLQKQNISAISTPSANVRTLPPAQVVSKDMFPWGDFPFEKIRVLGAAPIKESTSRKIQEKQGPTVGQRAASIGIMMATGLPIPIGPKSKTVEKTITDSEIEFYLDIITEDPTERRRIVGGNFNYMFLKERMLYNTIGNFRLLLSELVARAPKARRSRGLKMLVDSQPLSQMGYETVADLERECRWLYSLPFNA